MAVELEHLGRFEEAIASFEKALEISHKEKDENFKKI